MRRRRASIPDLRRLPWWQNLALGAVAWIILSEALPASLEAFRPLAHLSSRAADSAPWVSGFFVLCAIGTWCRQRSRRRLLSGTRDVEQIGALDWSELERLVGETYRRRGYIVRENGKAGADGGIDLVLDRGGEQTLVQVKRWSRKVGVPIVREMRGTLAASRARHAIIVTSSDFTRPARDLARGADITLVNGVGLRMMMDEARR